MKPCTVDSVLLASLEQFEYQAINRLLLAVLEEYEDSGTTQEEDVKTPAKMLPSSRSKHCMCIMHFCCKCRAITRNVKLKMKIEYQLL